MKILKTQWLEEMKDWTKKTMVEKDEKLNKVKKKKKKKHKRMLMMLYKNRFINLLLLRAICGSPADRKAQ